MDNNNELISLEESYSYLKPLNEEVIKSLKVDDTRDFASSKNYFLTKPQGVVIQDSFNNFAFPIRPAPQIDTNKVEFPLLARRFWELYIRFQHDMLPWHYVVEMIGNRYFVFNTRPITLRYPIKHKELLEREKDLPFNVKWSDETRKYIEDWKIDINEMIHVCILGDSRNDVYTRRFYKILGQFCVRPFLHWFKLPQNSKTRIVDLNMGSKFNSDYLFKFLYK